MKRFNITILFDENQLQATPDGGFYSITVTDAASTENVEANVQETGGSFFEFFEQQIVRKHEMGCLRTSETYRAALNKFKAFRRRRDLSPTLITPVLIEQFQAYMRSQDLCLNTISFYMRIIRAVYHRAVEMGMTRDRRPFEKAYTGIAKTSKRALPLEDIRKIAAVRLDDRNEEMARDQFLLSFYKRGMAFVDMAYLRKSDLQDGVLTYRRHKTGQLLSMAWEPEMQKITERWRTPKNSPYMLPIITRTGSPMQERMQYKRMLGITNKLLKSVARKAGVNANLTMYCARHSWASIARDENMPNAAISKGLGHASEKTTGIYLNSIDSAIIDRYNHQIISLVTEHHPKG